MNFGKNNQPNNQLMLKDLANHVIAVFNNVVFLIQIIFIWGEIFLREALYNFFLRENLANEPFLKHKHNENEELLTFLSVPAVTIWLSSG